LPAKERDALEYFYMEFIFRHYLKQKIDLYITIKDSALMRVASPRRRLQFYHRAAESKECADLIKQSFFDDFADLIFDDLKPHLVDLAIKIIDTLEKKNDTDNMEAYRLFRNRHT